jgi:hypothetical protein
MVLDFADYLCKGFSSDILVLENSYGRIILYISKEKIEKPSDKELKVLKNADTSYCVPLSRKMEKELNIDMKKVEHIPVNEREVYTIYEFTYLSQKVYIVEYYEGYGLTYTYHVYNTYDEALSSVFLG